MCACHLPPLYAGPSSWKGWALQHYMVEQYLSNLTKSQIVLDLQYIKNNFHIRMLIVNNSCSIHQKLRAICYLPDVFDHSIWR